MNKEKNNNRKETEREREQVSQRGESKMTDECITRTFSALSNGSNGRTSSNNIIADSIDAQGEASSSSSAGVGGAAAVTVAS